MTRDTSALGQLTNCYDGGHEDCLVHGTCKHHFLQLIAAALEKLDGEDITNLAHAICSEGELAGRVLWEYSRNNWPGEF